jgi:hypothetical protein
MRTGPSFVASNPRFREAFLGSPPRAAPAVNSAATYHILYGEAFLRHVHAYVGPKLKSKNMMPAASLEAL